MPHLMLDRSTRFRSSVTSDPTGIFSVSNSNTTQTHTHIQVSKAVSRCSIRSKVSERDGLAFGAAPTVEGECGATRCPAPFGGWRCPVGPSPPDRPSGLTAPWARACNWVFLFVPISQPSTPKLNSGDWIHRAHFTPLLRLFSFCFNLRSFMFVPFTKIPKAE